MQLTNKTFSAGEGTSGDAVCPIVGGNRSRLGWFGSENSAVTMRGLDGRAIDHEHEQEARYYPRNSGVLDETILMWLSGNHSEPCATFRVPMLDGSKRTCQRETWEFSRLSGSTPLRGLE